jgi:Ribonuclease G/E
MEVLLEERGRKVKEIMAAISLSDRALKLISELEIEGDINRKLEHLIERELIRRLIRYQLTNRLFKEKYGMSFDEFKKNKIVQKKNYSFEVESDFWDWEMALDGIETIERKLKVLKEPQDEHR